MTGSGFRHRVRLGTCSWSTRDWVGKVYSPTTKATDYIAEYARRYSTVEIDATFYGVPRRATIEGWRDRTPETFFFSAKAPQTITHEKFMAGCERDVSEFLTAMQILGPRLGPIVLQFPYYARSKNVTQGEFLKRLTPFLKTLPREDHKFVVEVRNKSWLDRRLFEVLQGHGVTLALIDHPWMHSSAQLLKLEGILTGPFAYIRWLGDRYGIEKLTKTWGEHVIDRRADIESWVPAIKQILDKQIPVWGYFNSHYSGFAPGDVDVLSELLGLTGATAASLAGGASP
ncbi:MAG: DUF72 domain-containing protein [Candidatus Hydrogenedentes bacterium]|nr:DUF72 domain-containing protein [Candidatus Hydrogenedentota bacterium]